MSIIKKLGDMDFLRLCLILMFTIVWKTTTPMPTRGVAILTQWVVSRDHRHHLTPPGECQLPFLHQLIKDTLHRILSIQNLQDWRRRTGCILWIESQCGSCCLYVLKFERVNFVNSKLQWVQQWKSAYYITRATSLLCTSGFLCCLNVKSMYWGFFLHVE